MSSKSSDFSTSSSCGSTSVDRNTSSFSTNGWVRNLNIKREVVFYHEYSSTFDRDLKAEKRFPKKAEM